MKTTNFNKSIRSLCFVFVTAASLNISLHSKAAYSLDANGNCFSEYAGGTPPQITNERLAARVSALCYTEFAIYHSGVTATPLWTAQHLTANEVQKAYTVDRDDVFHPEPRLPASERAELKHYRKSGYDRGHLAPAADMATIKAQDESFSMANMIPQMPQLNRGPWAKIEKTTREFAKQYGEVYIVSGPVFSGSNLKRIGGRVLVPSDTYKAIYLPSTGQSSAWWASNSTGAMEVISIAELSQRTGINIFPAVPEVSKAQEVGLPLPGAIKSPKPPVAGTQNKQTKNTKNSTTDTLLDTAVDFAIGYLKRLI